MADVISIAVGFLIGALFISVLVVTMPSTLHAKAKAAIAQCEKSLPRDQHCVLTAEPAKP